MRWSRARAAMVGAEHATVDDAVAATFASAGAAPVVDLDELVRVLDELRPQVVCSPELADSHRAQLTELGVRVTASPIVPPGVAYVMRAPQLGL